MSFGDHLEELRLRILLAMALPIPLSVITYYFSNTFIEWLVLPLKRAMDAQGLPTTLQQLSPPEFLITKIKLSVISALILTAPWLLWQAWQFISPGLYKQERRFIYLLLPGSAVLTAAGVLLMYFIMLPLMLYVLVGFGVGLQISQSDEALDLRVQTVLEQFETVELRHAAPEQPEAGQLWLLWPHMKLYASVEDENGAVEVLEIPRPNTSLISQEYHISKYIGFVLMLFLGIVIAFQMPLVVLLLGWMGLASTPWLKQNRKYALLVCGIVSAIITPADVISMLVMLAPLYGLYELGILLLIIAPASKVAEGRIFSLPRPQSQDADKGNPDKQSASSSQSVETAQPDDTIARTPPASQSQNEPPDGGGDE